MISKNKSDIFLVFCLSLTTLIVVNPPTVTSSSSVSCYECDSSADFSCTEFWDPTLPVTEQYYNNCSHVYDAKYCIKVRAQSPD